MKSSNWARGLFAGASRAALSLTLAVCLLLTALPTALGGTSVGRYPGDLTPSSAKVYIKLSSTPMLFTGDTYGTGSTFIPLLGTVLQLVSGDYYTHPTDGRDYFGVYYLSKRYNVLRTDVERDIMTDADLVTYITGTVWAQPNYPTLKKALNMVGDVRVHALQYALSILGYYDTVLDGDYGDKTVAAVKKFQRAKGLSPDGSAGPITQAVLYPLAYGGTIPGAGTGNIPGGIPGGGTGGGTATVGTLKTLSSVNLRKTATTKAVRIAVVPKGISLSYTDTSVSNGITWYRVDFNNRTGWLMGSFVSASSGSTGGTGGAAIGTVTIILPSTRVRKTPNGVKSGIVLAKGTVIDLLAQPTSVGGYAWYQVRTASGLVGYVRGDCCKANVGGVVPSANKTFVQLPAPTELFTTEARPATGSVMVNAGTVLQMVSPNTYLAGGETYCSVYYNNTKYNAVYSNVRGGIMTTEAVSNYITSLWNTSLTDSLKRKLGLVGDVRVYAMQLALSVTGYYTGVLDGNFGSGSESAVRNFQRKNKIKVDGACGNETWSMLCAQAKAIYNGGIPGGNPGGNPGGGTNVPVFGSITSIEKAPWKTVDGGSTSLFKKGTQAQVLDITTGQVFTIYRWSGGNHADCVPLTANDTKIMCDIVGFPYNAKHPTSAQLSQIKADTKNGSTNYVWPDFNNAWGGAKDVGSQWDRRPALVNVNGRVFCVSIYGYPHGFNGTDSFATAKFADGSYFYSRNNYYGMMCVHFVGSTTHTAGSGPDPLHQANIEAAYNYAKQHWPTLVK